MCYFGQSNMYVFRPECLANVATVNDEVRRSAIREFQTTDDEDYLWRCRDQGESARWRFRRLEERWRTVEPGPDCSRVDDDDVMRTESRRFEPGPGCSGGTWQSSLGDCCTDAQSTTTPNVNVRYLSNCIRWTKVRSWQHTLLKHKFVRAARIELQTPKRSDNAKPLLRRLHWLPIKQRIVYKTAVLTFKVRTTHRDTSLPQLSPTDTSQCAAPSIIWHTLAVTIFLQGFAERGFRHSAPAVWNSLPRTVLDSPSLTVVKSRLKTHMYFTWWTLTNITWPALPPPLKLRPYGGIEVCVLLLLLLLLLFGDGRISSHAARFHERCISSVTFTSTHLYGNVYISEGVAGALADSSDSGLLDKQSSQIFAIPCLGRRWTAEQNVTALALSLSEKSVTVQTNTQTNK